MKALVVFLALAGAFSLQPSQAQTQSQSLVLERIRASGRIVLAHRESSVPFSYRDGGGKPWATRWICACAWPTR